MGYNVSVISVDLPLPETPVTQINCPSGRLTETFFRLFPSAPIRCSNCPLPCRLCEGTVIIFLPVR